MEPSLQLTVRQICWKAGPLKLVKLLGSGRDAQRKWYSDGIPGRHWRALVRTYPWLTYEMIERANDIAFRAKKSQAKARPKRAA